MACTSLHKETGRWLTQMGADATPGSKHTLSVGHPLFGGEFTTYRLGPVVAIGRDAYGDAPLFDMEEAEVSITGRISWEDEDQHIWLPLAEVREAIRAKNAEAGPNWRTLELRGLTFTRGSFGQWMPSIIAA